MTVGARSTERSLELFLYRLMAAASLNGSMYEAIEADRRLSSQAAATVLLSSIAAAIGAAGPYGLHVSTFLATTALALVTWIAWAMLMFQIGVRMLPEPQTRATFGELLRTTGFAAAPGLLQAFAILPGMTAPVFVGTWVWMIAAMVIGVRHALDYRSTWRALAVCLVAASLSLAVAMGLGVVFAPAVN
jgi:hypothetical protein